MSDSVKGWMLTVCAWDPALTALALRNWDGVTRWYDDNPLTPEDLRTLAQMCNDAADAAETRQPKEG